MKLKTKLLLSIGSLLVAMTLLIAILASYLVQSDLHNTASKIRTILQGSGGGDFQQQEAVLRKTLNELIQHVTTRITFQILLIAGLVTLLALFILNHLAKTISRPISRLAQAAIDVGEGKYEAVSLPKTEKKDEISLLTNSFGEMVKGIKEREMIRAVLNKVISKDVAEEILKKELHLGGEDRVVTMLFSDIRHFTELTERLPPQETINLLNSTMTKMSRVIEAEGGVIDKYVGDEIIALYGAPVATPDHALRALSSAKIMIETLRKWNEERSKNNLPPIEMGIGIHSGLVVVGNMGAEDRLNYTVVGANANLAARLCQIAKPMQIIISEATWNEQDVKDSFYVEPLPPITLKGFSEPVNIYQIVGFKWT